MAHILIGVPTPEYIHNEFALGNLPDIVSHARAKYPDLQITICHKNGTRTDANRNVILKEALEDGTVDYILWLDADMLYPVDIIERYLDLHKMGREITVVGCMYFKRSKPFNPIAYNFSGEKVKPFKTILPSVIKEDQIYEVDGLGYGGMMVSMKVYEALGADKWTVYGENFHLPYDTPNHMTHDLDFCMKVRKKGIIINLHGGVRPGHLANIPITIDHWRQEQEKEFKFQNYKPKVLVIIPTTDIEQAKTVANVMRLRAGHDCDIAVVEDDKRVGFVKTLNTTAQQTDHEVIVYTAQDALVGQNWLKNALTQMLLYDAGLVGFNDGKWDGRLASFGMVNRKWVNSIYEDGSIMFPGYNSHYGDTELTQIAKQQDRYSYAEKAIMLEVDWNKAQGNPRPLVRADKKLYKKRKESGFDGLITSKELIEEFS